MEEHKDFRERALKRVKQGLGRLCRRRSVTITEYDPSFKVLYLGNVLTGWARGEGCVEKPLSTLWTSYQNSGKPDVQMKVTVCQSGLKAVTKEHGLTEYWSNRITYCAAPASYPRVFCWVYRHEGRRLKQELRCHAVLCNKEATARRMAQDLSFRLAQALIEFKRDKISKQNARLSLANAVYDNPSLPRRKILLSTGSQNYRPPLERSKSAPKLMSIEESVEEEEEGGSSTAVTGWRRTGRAPPFLRRADTTIEGDPFETGIHVPGDFEYSALEEQKVEDNPDVCRVPWATNRVNDSVINEAQSLLEELLTCSSRVDTNEGDDGDDEHQIERDTTMKQREKDVSVEDLRRSPRPYSSLIITSSVDFFDEESTPSLQSISSSSESQRARRDSFSDGCEDDDHIGRRSDDREDEEEDSDESGFVETSSAADDKIRDLPHHQLVKTCLHAAKIHTSLHV